MVVPCRSLSPEPVINTWIVQCDRNFNVGPISQDNVNHMCFAWERTYGPKQLMTLSLLISEFIISFKHYLLLVINGNLKAHPVTFVHWAFMSQFICILNLAIMHSWLVYGRTWYLFKCLDLNLSYLSIIIVTILEMSYVKEY
jgi:hypothetical protein